MLAKSKFLSLIASLAFTVATASVAVGRVIVPGTRSMNDPTALPTLSGGGGGAVVEDPYRPPLQPFITGPVSRTETTLTVRLWDRSSYETGYELYRGPSDNGPWTSIALMNPFTNQVDYPDSGLSPDTRYCYRLRAFNGYGESFSYANCFPTLDGRSVWRVQLRLRTANVEDAGTDDGVYVMLNGHNLTWIDYGGDDLERGDEFTYDLVLDGVSDLADVNAIGIAKEGTDGWCIESLSLLVNSKDHQPVEIYNEYFGSTAATCHWLDWASAGIHGSYTVPHARLRAHPLWQNFQQPDPQMALGMPREELESRIESMVGNKIHGKDAYWGDLDGDRYVEVSFKDEKAIHVTLDLVAEVPLTRNPEVDLSFDLRFAGSCTDGQTPLEVHITPENIQASADADWWEEVVTFWINFLEGDVADAVVNGFPNLAQTLSLNPGKPACVDPVVGQNGSLSLIPSFPSPKPPTKAGGLTAGGITGTYDSGAGGTPSTPAGTTMYKSTGLMFVK
jgi:hypothetical protein